MVEGKLIKLPMNLGFEINKILKTKMQQFTPRLTKSGFPSFEFTEKELALIDKLKFENPTTKMLVGIELLPNLKFLCIKSNYDSYYKRARDLASISDADMSCIAKCSNLEYLEINNQGNIFNVDISKMPNLKTLILKGNARLEEIVGLENTKNLEFFKCYGNELLVQIKNLRDIIINNPELTDMYLDVLLFPDVVSNMNSEIISRLNDMDVVKWIEILSPVECITISNYQMFKMHKKACDALRKYVPPHCDKVTAVIGIEQYLSENVRYDNQAVKSNHTHSTSGIVSGPNGGANGAYNAFMYNTCVCEGYTRAMQYLLKLKKIKSYNVACIAGEDKLHMSTDKGNDNKIYILPDHGYHSIISIADINYLYDDPCWNACRYQKGNKSMPWILLTKEEISKDHTLSFVESDIDNNFSKTERKDIEKARQRIKNYIVLGKVVYHFASLTKIDDKKIFDDLIAKLSVLNTEEQIYYILVFLNSLLNRRILTEEQIFSNICSIRELNPQNYKTSDDLIKKFQWIRSMNKEYPVPLTENHKCF